MPQQEVTIVGKLNNKAVVTGEGALLVEVTNSGGGGPATNVTETNSADILSQSEIIAQNTADTANAVNQGNSVLQDINNNIVNPGVFSIPEFIRTTTNGVSSNNLYSISIANTGVANGDVLGTVLKPGETITFDAGNRLFNTGSISWDATGTEFIITTLSRL